MKLLAAVALTFFLATGWAADAPAPAPMQALTGKVLEVKDVDMYTYLRLKTQNGEIWAAVSKAPVKVGSDVTIENSSVMTNFESKALKKTFDKIVFGNLAGPAAAGGDMAQQHAGVQPVADAGDIKVPKASGANAHTVAEIIGNATKLKDKTVVIHAKVVKFNPNILGKNWIHVRDGSGTAAANTNDILVTTNDLTKVGDVITVKGTVRTDKDLGSGYFYKVLVDDSTLQK